MSDMVTIAVDALGGDFGPSVVLPGVEAALAAEDTLQVMLCGPEDVVVPFAQQHERCEAVPCTQEIAMDEHPANAVRHKKDSSIVVGCRLVKEGRAQGFFSAGSTGACLAAGTLVAGRIKGVARPALSTIIPSPVRPVVMCDVGANADCKPEFFAQFGKIRETDPAAEEAQALVKKLQAYITEHFYTCTKEILGGLGKMYAGGGDFTTNIDRMGGEGTAEFASRAIAIYCRS